MPDDTDTTGQRSERREATGLPISRRGFLAGSAAVGAASVATATAALPGSRTQTDDQVQVAVRIENVSTETTLRTTAMGQASEQPVPLSPGAYAVHTAEAPIFTAGEPERDNGLEEIAEDGQPTRLVESLSAREDVVAAGAFTTPVDADEPSPIGPGGAYEFTVSAEPEAHLSFATMFVPSNDLFYAPDEEGIALFQHDGDPVAGDVTDEVGLWDAGTEVNEEPGVGENQVQRQRGPGVGLVERGTVAGIDDVNGYTYPAVADVVRVTLAPMTG